MPERSKGAVYSAPLTKVSLVRIQSCVTFPCSLMVRITRFHRVDPGSIPGMEANVYSSEEEHRSYEPGVIGSNPIVRIRPQGNSSDIGGGSIALSEGGRT